MTNPLWSELNNLSPGAKAALAQAYGAATSAAAAQPPKLLTDPSKQQLPPAICAPPTPAGPPPLPTSLPTDNGNSVPRGTMPSLPPAPTAAPIQAPPGTSAGDQQERSRLLSTGSGISQVKNPFLRGLGEVGNAVGHIFLPGLMRDIPGTEEHHE